MAFSGFKFAVGSCCGCPSPSPSASVLPSVTCPTGCGEDGIPRRWRVVISGVSDGVQSGCSAYNGTYDFEIEDCSAIIGGDRCRDVIEIGPTGGSAIHTLQMGFEDDGSGNLLIFVDFENQLSSPANSCVNGTSNAVFLKTGSYASLCSAESHVLNNVSDNGSCSGIPSSLTVTAI